ncbi:non-canonical purine NTP pyrophosphatase [Halomarina oriensis]|uniref:Non-canonical purine NTP pyrophosphatase n=1 Tax=Halomarina oriensis TaxID=671145 RepID=A0A6B0GNK5_9EURY|nr:non-canonical purine NTP pyrophosphatase [Halomarina oriensis]MWG34263.1 non-canonical purine NTP pyrophosphatase [Halomarina oriensis]
MISYVTTNDGKVREAREYLADVRAVDFDYTEIQAAELGPIAAHGAREAFAHVGGPVLVDDAGLFVDGFDGFPGPYSAYVEHTLGVDRVGDIARRRAEETGETPRAQFRCVLAYCDGEGFAATPDAVDYGDRRGHDLSAEDRGTASTTDSIDAGDVPVKLFAGVVRGRIVEPRGEGGFGYDPVFEHDGSTLAEMSAAEKNAISHRGRALATFAEFYAER